MRKLTRRSYNRKLIVFGLAIFLAFGMISTGFAAWLISSAATAEPNAPVEVDTIVDKSFELTIDDWDSENKTWSGETISFDAVKGDNTGRIKHQPEAADDAGEQLELLLSGTVTNMAALGKQNESATAGAVKVDITLPDTLVAAITAKYLTASYVVGDVATPITTATTTVWLVPTANDEDATKGDFAVTLKFGWGEEFGKMNPSEYYDLIEDKEDPDYIPDAQMKTELTEFRATLIGGDASDEEVLIKEYTGTIKFTVTASASY